MSLNNEDVTEVEGHVGHIVNMLFDGSRNETMFDSLNEILKIVGSDKTVDDVHDY